MAHPKHKQSSTRRDKRRSHDAISVNGVVKCSNCGAAVKYHTVCPECGYMETYIEDTNKVKKLLKK